MKVLFLTKLYYPHIGGVEKHVYEVGKRLKLNGKSVTVLTEKYDTNLRNEEISEGIKIVRFSYPKVKFFGLLYIWFWLFRNRNLIQKSDIVHCHDIFIWYFPFRFLYPNKPVYTTFHGWEGIYPIPRKYIFLKKLAARLSRGNICVGHYIEKYYGIKADKVVYGA